ncbi:MAG: SDR family oxidoreductase [Rhodospirillales bacterium]|nr:SDR family oxidoreductase [Rhodospirillales bacterium]
MDLSGKTALVTGGTSGIGAETARVFAAAGASVMLVGRRAEAAQELVEQIAEAGGVAAYLLGDVSGAAFAERAVCETVERFGALTVLANVAGTIFRGNAEETSDGDWRTTMAVNLDATFYMSRAAIPQLRAAGGGSIVNLGSTVGLVGTRGLAAYCASKAAVVNLTRAMALDHAAENIRINSVNPGAVDTPMLVSGHGDRDADAVRAANRASIPQGWLPSPAEVAQVIAFLASDESRHITGVALPVDGGFTAA